MPAQKAFANRLRRLMSMTAETRPSAAAPDPIALKRNRPRRREAAVADIEPSSSVGTMRMPVTKPSAVPNGVTCRSETACVGGADICGPFSSALGVAMAIWNCPWRCWALLLLCHSAAAEGAGASPLLIGSTRQRASVFYRTCATRGQLLACASGSIWLPPASTDRTRNGRAPRDPGFQAGCENDTVFGCARRCAA